ncbi:DUF981 domain-containing protein [Actinocorallia sp. A-T 12471]|uniref:DUF981 domain-containing protein n=1 Tax=Actinocorallia sp. A-T 12471 TaxID=3089813 RepID=UPI0029CFFCAB|nr:DUF981 domain-containing protein [Actinocorallia sp. A-T 12471]MDX6743844.1 DUF981 domain-containing protein [Actinocorallia sp. A-T 12471]
MVIGDAGAVQAALKINWAEMPTYNTIMAVAAGAGLLLVAGLWRKLSTPGGELHAEGWALAFGVLGTILTLTGLHMTLTWPLAAGGFPFDNIIFGEPSLAFGVLLLFAGGYLWRRGRLVEEHPERERHLAGLAGPVSVFVFGMGLACWGIAAAGVWYQLFAAPKEEPISGLFADHPMVEAVFVSLLYFLVGLGAVLFPFALGGRRAALGKVIVWAWAISGALFLLFGALNYFTHIGLIVNTM